MNTWAILDELALRLPALHPIQNHGEHGFGHAIIHGFGCINGDAAVVMMSDESDDCRDVVRYSEVLNQGWDAVFGPRFMRGEGVIDYPAHKLLINRLANMFLRLLFRIRLNDTTNAFKAYRRKVIQGCEALSLTSRQSHCGVAIEGDRKRVLMDRRSNYLEKSPSRCFEA